MSKPCTPAPTGSFQDRLSQLMPLSNEAIDKIIDSNITTQDVHLRDAFYLCMRDVEVSHGIHETGDEDEIGSGARLIAAAPELLESLQEVTFLLEALLKLRGEPHPGSIGAKARAAIAKATTN